MNGVSAIDVVGYGAASLVLATFCMRSMTTLRCAAVASNVAFIAYGYLEHLVPVLVLHVLLLPVNVYRLAQLRSERARSDQAEACVERGRESAHHDPLGGLRGAR
jgi:hypothetical protein